MDPVTISALIGGGTSLLQGLMGNSAAKKQAKEQQRNNMQMEAIAREQQELAELLAERGVATQIDANGNVTAYDKATNTWKTVLSPTQQAMQNLSDREQINQLKVDAPVNRVEGLVNAIARSKAGGTADAARMQLEDQMRGGYNGQDLGSILALNRTRAVNQGFDNVSSALTQQALRSGAAGGGALAGALAKQRSQAIASTMGNPQIEGMQLAESMNQSKMGSLYNNWQGANAMASGGGGGTFNPVPIATNASAAAAGARTGANGALTGAGSLLNSAGSLLNARDVPDYNTNAPLMTAFANLFGAGGTGNDVLTRALSGRKKLGDITVER